jgi:nitroimidazol reductase NimA-like FMN-containing flavoprotein (pyridoxamine 5'-phosphate oxidase superfamily)
MHDVGVAMSEAQIEAFLEDHTSGVLAYGGTTAEEPPDSEPVAYGYDRRNDAIVIPFPSDGPATTAEESPAVSFTVHDSSGGVRSVVLSGTLRPLPAESVDRAIAVFETNGPDGRRDGLLERSASDPEWYTLAGVDKRGRQPAQAGPQRSARP